MCVRVDARSSTEFQFRKPMCDRTKGEVLWRVVVLLMDVSMVSVCSGFSLLEASCQSSSPPSDLPQSCPRLIHSYAWIPTNHKSETDHFFDYPVSRFPSPLFFGNEKRKKMWMTKIYFTLKLLLNQIMYNFLLAHLPPLPTYPSRAINRRIYRKWYINWIESYLFTSIAHQQTISNHLHGFRHIRLSSSYSSDQHHITPRILAGSPSHILALPL